MFIVFEGLDGSGKTTQIELLSNRLQAVGVEVVLTAEPTELPTGRLIRDILEHRVTAHPQALAALYAADRIEHLHHPETGILAELTAGKTVISSRYYFSSLAYQAEGDDLAWIAALNQQAKNTKTADLTFFLDLTPEVSMERITRNRQQVDLFENVEKLTRVRTAFKKGFAYWGDEKENIHIINAEQSIQAVAEEIWHVVKQAGSLSDLE